MNRFCLGLPRGRNGNWSLDSLGVQHEIGIDVAAEIFRDVPYLFATRMRETPFATRRDLINSRGETRTALRYD